MSGRKLITNFLIQFSKLEDFFRDSGELNSPEVLGAVGEGKLPFLVRVRIL